jgi:hypothetical protein
MVRIGLMILVMRDEIATTMRLLGVTRLDQLGPHLVCPFPCPLSLPYHFIWSHWLGRPYLTPRVAITMIVIVGPPADYRFLVEYQSSRSIIER